jgi:hypothetical protein
MSRSKPLRTTLRSTAMSSRLAGSVYALYLPAVLAQLGNMEAAARARPRTLVTSSWSLNARRAWLPSVSSSKGPGCAMPDDGRRATSWQLCCTARYPRARGAGGVVQGDDLAARSREVQGERRHVAAEVVDPEDEVSGSASGVAPQCPAIPGYTSPYLWPEALIGRTWGSLKSHSTSSWMKRATNPPDAASTCSGMSRPRSSCRRSSAAEISATGS